MNREQIIKSLRKNPTKSEVALRSRFRFEKFKFKFQPFFDIGEQFFVVDFMLWLKRPSREIRFLGVEVDGKSHDGALQQISDTVRTNLLKSQKITIIRFSNDDVLYNIDKVIDEIKRIGVHRGYEVKKDLPKNDPIDGFEFKIKKNVTPQQMEKQMEYHRKMAASGRFGPGEVNRHFAAFTKLRNELIKLRNTKSPWT